MTEPSQLSDDGGASTDPAAAPAQLPKVPPVADPRRPTLGRNVYALALVSFLTDVSSEMIYPLLPAFLTVVLGAGAEFIGVIEGAAESTAALLKLASGWWSDRVRRRKPLVVVGYVIASAVRPLVAMAQSATQVLAIRVTDRIGKGIRNSPRDALIADSVHPSIRGRAFGFHRGADNAGGVVGPLIAFAILTWWHVSLRAVFWLALIPGALAVVAVMVGVRDPGARSSGLGGRGSGKNGLSSRSGSASPNPEPRAPTSDLGGPFWAYLIVILIFTLGNSTDAFLLLRAQQLGVPVALAPILWAFLHVVKSLSNTPGGALSDRIGRKPTLVAGWIVYAAVYFAFGHASAHWHAWALFGMYGLYFGLTEGTERAFVSDLVPLARRGTAFGWYYLAIGIGALPASVIFGYVWERYSSTAAFTLGAVLALTAAVGILGVPAINSTARPDDRTGRRDTHARTPRA